MAQLTDTWDETLPPDGEAINNGDDRIREFKKQMREVWQIDHTFPSTGSKGDATLGFHKAVRLKVQSAPSAVADVGIVYSEDVSAKAELHYFDEDSNKVQITVGGKINIAAMETDITRTKTGDWMTSSVTTARTGWTDVSASHTGKFMRVDTTPGGTGGSDTHTHTAGSYALAHTHNVTVPTDTTPAGGGGASVGQEGVITSAGASTTAVTGSSASGDNVPAFVEVGVFQKD